MGLRLFLRLLSSILIELQDILPILTIYRTILSTQKNKQKNNVQININIPEKQTNYDYKNIYKNNIILPMSSIQKIFHQITTLTNKNSIKILNILLILSFVIAPTLSIS